MSTQEKIIQLTNTLVQQRGFQGFSYADLEAGIGIRKASIHHHFPSKTDLGLAYCDYKTQQFQELAAALRQLPAGVPRLKGYLDAFADCAAQGQMCGAYAMLTDSHLLLPELQIAVYRLAQTEQHLLQDILATGQHSKQLHLAQPPAAMAMVVSSALKGALLLNRVPPHAAYADAVTTIIRWLSADTASSHPTPHPNQETS
ncbi:TetR/AcrR family transcriptional regulator [Comamonas piscis]|uniref:TetR/AcrR family transcriptional regulator n=2 Tax=Comamonas piscis TaxID=1562974 RepID=A0A7G5ENN8_9BURK|nr:TetR/AcrR family transcriptional regulator [Comamonas piscis]